MSGYLLHLVLGVWTVAFAATMGWGAALSGSHDQDWYREERCEP